MKDEIQSGKSKQTGLRDVNVNIKIKQSKHLKVMLSLTLGLIKVA